MASVERGRARSRTILGFLLLATAAAGCASAGGAAKTAPGSAAPGAPAVVELRVAAAASLRTAAVALADAFAAANPGVSVTVATDSSAALRTQIEQGAPFDLFLSADVANARALADGGLAAGDPVPFATSSVALVVPADNPARITAPADLARPGLRLIAAGAKVPITAYVDQVIVNLASVPGYPAGFVAAVGANVVSREDNVAAVLAKVELGEGDAGFVYATDAAASAKVLRIAIPEASNVRAEYAGVVVADSRYAEMAAAFLSWVAGPDGRAILGPYGFLAP
jgi:molybdate transport system substrate-binding protein